MPLLSEYARRRKVEFFFGMIDRDARILEVGAGSGWVGDWCHEHGYEHYTGLDLKPPADIVGDIKDWRELGIEPGSFDVIIAFEVVEHTACFGECYEILTDGGRMMITTPVPHWDLLLRALEVLGLNQPRYGPHNHLVYLRDVPVFERREIRIVAGLSQLAVFHKEPCADERRERPT
jgi:hypothetical protein